MSTIDELLSESKIGEPREKIPLELRADHQKTVRRLAELARHEILIVSRHLDPSVYGTEDFMDVMSPFVRSKRASVRILVNDSRSMVKDTHRLAEMAVSLSSKISIRRLGLQEQQYNEAWMLADEVALLHLPQSDLYKGSMDFYSPRYGKEHKELFDSMWSHAELIPELRALKI